MTPSEKRQRHTV